MLMRYPATRDDKKNRRRSLKLLLCLALGCVYSVQVWGQSACAATSGLPAYIVFPGTIAVSPNLQYGDTIPGTVRSFAISGSCTIGAGNSTATIQVGTNINVCSTTGNVDLGSGIYTAASSNGDRGTDTGVGIRLRDSAGKPLTRPPGADCTNVISTIGAGGAYSFSGTMELVRTAVTIPSTGVTVSSNDNVWTFGVHATGNALNNRNGNWQTPASSIRPAASIQLRNITCTRYYPTLVTLPNISAAALPNVGSVAGTTPFQIGLQCLSSATVGVTFDAADGIGVVAGYVGTLQVQAGGATGVGLQIVAENQNPVTFQSRMELGLINANGRRDFSYFVRYIRTQPTITPGPANSAAIFTFDYQ